jgi:uncharacterized membrane protein
MTVEEGIKLVLSGGIIAPGNHRPPLAVHPAMAEDSVDTTV